MSDDTPGNEKKDRQTSDDTPGKEKKIDKRLMTLQAKKNHPLTTLAGGKNVFKGVP